jgi:eukaryotic-like serine/threonine-protein kinase
MFFRGQTIGKYRILAPLGSGGFGAVYLAEDTWIDKKVALKVPHRQNLDFGELLKEPRLLASLNHPNVVTVLTAERQDNVFFIVMEYVPGDTLESIIEREGALDLARVLDYTCQICNAVDHAHRHGVIHRDLRPGNVLVSEQGLVKVADFGTSRFLEIAAHGTTVIGSPPYMAPEQFQGKAVFASDIYSLGVTMYQMLIGSLPYRTPQPGDLDRLIKGELVTPPKERNQKIPKGISDIIMRALAPDVGSRYQRAADLLDALLAARARPAGRARPAVATGSVTGERRPWRPAPLDSPTANEHAEDIQARLRARETPQPRFCWHCRKALHARTDKCPFCGESQR